jgi:hypothetical protein
VRQASCLSAGTVGGRISATEASRKRSGGHHRKIEVGSSVGAEHILPMHSKKVALDPAITLGGDKLLDADEFDRGLFGIGICYETDDTGLVEMDAVRQTLDLQLEHILGTSDPSDAGSQRGCGFHQ